MVLASDIFHCSAFLALYKWSELVGKSQYNDYPQFFQGNFPARDSVLLNFSITKSISKFPLFPARSHHQYTAEVHGYFFTELTRGSSIDQMHLP